MASYPTGLKVYLDDIDITYYIFGADTFDASDTKHIARDIDLTSFISVAGVHHIVVSAEAGSGRVDCRVEIA